MKNSTKKCPVCNSCLGFVWVLPNRYLYCDFCRDYYTLIDDKITLVDRLTIFPSEILGVQENQKN